MMDLIEYTKHKQIHSHYMIGVGVVEIIVQKKLIYRAAIEVEWS